MSEWRRIDDVLAHYTPLVNDTPALLSILYDTDLLPEQITDIRGAVCLAAVCEAYQAGRDT